ncbi:MAG: phytanoyl-CoA dioxygenase family protein [Pseudomonadota bacterium]
MTKEKSRAKSGLSEADVAQFHRDGYLVVPDLLDPERHLAPVIDEYQTRLRSLRDVWVAQGLLPKTGRPEGFCEGIKEAAAAGIDFFQPLDISLPLDSVEADTPFHAGPATFALLTAPPLLDAVEALIGPEITSNPIQHVRIKPPARDVSRGERRAHVTATSWHQDRAVTLSEADETRMVTAWLAVTDATQDNGCLKVLPGSHKGLMLHHCPVPQLAIPDQFIDEAAAVPLPVRAGGVVLFHPLTVHGSLDNRSDSVRWSFDLRYNTTGDPTGRPLFPAFVARSKAYPDTVLTDPLAWRQSWLDARSTLAASPPREFHRWPADAALCA